MLGIGGVQTIKESTFKKEDGQEGKGESYTFLESNTLSPPWLHNPQASACTKGGDQKGKEQ